VQSSAVKCNQVQSRAIKGNQAQSSALKCSPAYRNPEHQLRRTQRKVTPARDPLREVKRDCFAPCLTLAAVDEHAGLGEAGAHLMRDPIRGHSSAIQCNPVYNQLQSEITCGRAITRPSRAIRVSITHAINTQLTRNRSINQLQSDALAHKRNAHHRLEDGGIQRTLHLAPARHGEVEGRYLPKPLSERRAAIDVPDEGGNRRSSRAIKCAI
jgi:hypothetical protein